MQCNSAPSFSLAKYDLDKNCNISCMFYIMYVFMTVNSMCRSCIFIIFLSHCQDIGLYLSVETQAAETSSDIKAVSLVCEGILSLWGSEHFLLCQSPRPPRRRKLWKNAYSHVGEHVTRWEMKQRNKTWAISASWVGFTLTFVPGAPSWTTLNK